MSSVKYTFNCITSSQKTGDPKPEMFRAACEEIGVVFKEVDCESFDIQSKRLGRGDLLYRISTGKRAHKVERMLMSPEVTTFYRNNNSAYYKRVASDLLLANESLPSVPTVSYPTTNRDTLDQIVESLGGYPIVVKVPGGMEGVGVTRLDSRDSLFSVVDVLVDQGISFDFKKYVQHTRQGRLEVLAERVLAARENLVTKEDFRSNLASSSFDDKRPAAYSPEVEKIAIQAVQALGIEFGGVDIIFDENEQPWITEVNFPDDFSYTQKICEVNVAKYMVEYLVEKAEKAAIA